MIDVLRGSETLTALEKSKSIDRPAALVEIRIKGIDGVFILLLNPSNPKRKDEWELPGGSCELDIEGKAESEGRWQRHEYLLPDDYDLPGDYVDPSVIEASFRKNATQDSQREKDWLIEQAIKELKEETGIDVVNAEISALTMDADGRSVSRFHYVTGGTGRELEIISTPYLIRLLPTDALPEIRLSDEHTEFMYLHFPGWRDNSRNKMSLFRNRLGVGCQSSECTSLNLRPTDNERVYEIPYDGEDGRSILVSPITSQALERYLWHHFYRMIRNNNFYEIQI